MDSPPETTEERRRKLVEQLRARRGAAPPKDPAPGATAGSTARAATGGPGPGQGFGGFGGQGFGGHGFGGFGTPGFGGHGYGAPGFGSPGFGAPGFGSPGFGWPGMAGAGGVPPDAPTDPIVALKPGDGPALFLVHAVFGSVFPYHRLALHLPPHAALYGFQARGLDGTQEPRDRIPDMARAYVDAMRTIRPEGPYRIAGYSFGAWIAWEMARMLAAEGADVPWVALLGVAPPPSAFQPDLVRPLDPWIDGMVDAMRLFRNLQRAERPDPAGGDGTTASQRILLANGFAAARYVPEPADLRAWVIVTPEQQGLRSVDPSMGWSLLARGGVETHELTGNHLSMFDEPHVAALGRWFGERLAGDP